MPAVGEELLGDVHHLDVLGEEDDLADVVRELRGIVGGQAGLRLADAAHQAEHVLAGLRRSGSDRSHPATWRTRSWSMPSTVLPEVRVASALW